MESQVDQKELSDGIVSVIPGVEHATAIPVLFADSLTAKEFIENWVDKSRPCLIKGAVKHWPAIEKWKSEAYWLASCKDESVKVAYGRNFSSPKPDELKEMTFYDAVKCLFSGKDRIFRISARKITADSHVADLEKDTPGFSFLPSPEMPRRYPRKRILMYRRASSNWHYHPMDETLMCQVKGAKKLLLLPPDLPKIEYVDQYLSNDAYLSGDVLDQSLDLRPMTIEVEEGDATYIPPFWYHGVFPTEDEPGFTLIYCWKSPWHVMGDFSNYLLRVLYKKHPYMFNNNKISILAFSGYARVRYWMWKYRNPAD